jgi:hypothetical protein
MIHLLLKWMRYADCTAQASTRPFIVSVFTGAPELRTGRLVSVKPDACPHDVWRYGYAFPVGVKA